MYNSEFPAFLKKSIKTVILLSLVLTFIISSLYFFKSGKVKVVKSCINCNLILISVDTLSAKHLPCYGYPRITAPNLCKFGEDNIYFKNTFSQSSFTLDSHMSVMTSLYPNAHNVRHLYKDTLNPDIKTLASVLNDNGYDTNYIGVTDDPTLPLTLGIERGFDNIIKSSGEIEDLQKGLDIITNNIQKEGKSFIFFHTYSVHAPYVFPENYTDWSFAKGDKFDIPLTVKEYHNFSGDFFKYALDFMKQRIEKSDTKESLERNLNFYNGLKNAKNPESAEEFARDNYYLDLESMYYWWYFRNINPENNSQVNYLNSLYDDRIKYTDKKLKVFFDKLRDDGYLKNTIVVITSDHGEEFAEHGFLGHGDNIYESQTHVPLIMAIPGIYNFVSDELTQSIDIMPTVLSFLGIKSPVYIQGLDLSVFLSGGTYPIKERHIISQHHNKLLKSVRTGKWRLYTNGKGDSIKELYNIEADPDEKSNVLDENPEIADKLRNKLVETLTNIKIFPQLNENFPDWIDSKERQRLIEKGYF